MEKMDDILDLHWNITAVIRYTSPKQEEIGLWKQLIFFPRRSRYHFLQLNITPLKPQRT
jgi:hypothetical protein